MSPSSIVEVPPVRRARNPNPDPHWLLTSEEVQQGNVLWLGTYEGTLASFSTHGNHGSQPVHDLATRRPAPRGMYNHPIVVLSRLPNHPNIMLFTYCTTFGGKGLPPNRRTQFMAFSSSTQHPLWDHDRRYRTLHLTNGDEMLKPSWIFVDQVFMMDWRDAKVYWGSNNTLRRSWQLDERSIHALTSLVSSRTDIAIPIQALTTTMTLFPRSNGSEPAASSALTFSYGSTPDIRTESTAVRQLDSITSRTVQDVGVLRASVAANIQAPSLEAARSREEREREPLLPRYHNGHRTDAAARNDKGPARHRDGCRRHPTSKGFTWLAIGVIMVMFTALIFTAVLW